MKIILGSDHIGFKLKKNICAWLKEKNYEIEDIGCHSEARVDYTDYSKILCQIIITQKFKFGILICGTGIGMSISANKIKGIRAAACSDVYSAKMSRAHNNTNILCLGSKVVGTENAYMMIGEWINTEFEEGRHQQRVKNYE